MNWLDFILLIIILFGLILGLIKGFITQLSSFVGLIIGVVVARLFYLDFASFLQAFLSITPYYAKPLAFVIIFFVVAILCHLVSLVLNKLLKAIALGWFNRLTGAIFGALKYILILSVVINAFLIFNEKIKLVSDATIENSVLCKPVGNVFTFLLPYFRQQNAENSATIANSSNLIF